MNPTCTEVDIYDDIKACAGEVNLPGVRPFFFYIKKSNITGWPTLPAPSAQGTKMEDVAVFSGSFTLASSVNWNKVDMVPDSATFGCESQGNWGSKTFNNTATLVIPGTKEEATGLISLLNNDDVVFLVPGRDGKCRFIGAEEFSVVANMKEEQGAAAASDSAQTTIELSCTSPVALPFYPGNIVTADGTISGADLSPVTGG